MADPTDVWPPRRCANPACGGEVAWPGGGLWRCRTCGLRHRPVGQFVFAWSLLIVWIVCICLAGALLLSLLSPVVEKCFQ